MSIICVTLIILMKTHYKLIKKIYMRYPIYPFGYVLGFVKY